MKKYLLLALVSLLFPVIAGAIEPKKGHYGGEATAGGGIIRKHFTFDYGIHGVFNIRLDGKHVGYIRFSTSGEHFHFKFYGTTSDFNRYQGHGIWHGDEKSAGDFREYLSGLGDTNIYYTWHVHWKHH